MSMEYVGLPAFMGLPSGSKVFRPGQGEATEAIVRHLEYSDEIVVELCAPTGAGKTLILGTVGNYQAFKGRRVTYCTPQATEVDQIQSSILDSGGHPLPGVVGRGRYNCALVPEVKCDECAFPKKPLLCSEVKRCPYQNAKKAFMNSNFGVTTLDYALLNSRVRRTRKILFIDEASRLEGSLLKFMKMMVPVYVLKDKRVDLPSLKNWIGRMKVEKAPLDSQLKDIGYEFTHSRLDEEERKRAIQALKDITGKIMKLERRIRSANLMSDYVQEQEPYIIDKDGYFQPLFGKRYFALLCEGMKIVLASATPTTTMLCDSEGFVKVDMSHPIPVSQRRVVYLPVSPMGRRGKTPDGIRDMAFKVLELHEREASGRHTLVHCHSLALAKELYAIIGDDHRVILQQPGKKRKESLDLWGNTPEAIFLSFSYEHSLNLKGPAFPLNIIAKVPYPDLGNEVERARQELPGGQRRYDLETAMTIMQASGRTTRDITDFSKTYILDRNFGSFFLNNQDLFSLWFKEALERADGKSLVPPKPRWLTDATTPIMNNHEQSKGLA